MFDEKPPEFLYHYTTQAGLLGILEKKEIWATHTRYLNDRLEFRHAFKLMREVIDKARTDAPHRAPALDELEKALKANERTRPPNVCVSSFCADDGDLLSQWRAYGGNASGFSIGFPGEFLRAVGKRTGFELVRCVYSDTEQWERLQMVLDDVLRIPAHVGPLSDLFILHLNTYAPTLKHSAFEAEKEWRIVSGREFADDERFAFRQSRSTLIPYYKIPLQHEGLPLEISRLIVGPTPLQKEARRAAQTLMERYGFPGAKVLDTKVPYRNW